MLAFGGVLNLWAQDSTLYKIKHLQVTGVDEGEKTFRKFKRVQDSLAIEELRHQYEERLARKGFAEFGFDEIRREEDSLIVNVHQGPLYIIDSIHLHHLNETFAEKAGLDKLERRRSPLDWEDLRSRLMQCLDEYQNSGYPFARFDSLDLSYNLRSDTMLTRISYTFDPGKMVTIDSVEVKGDIREHDAFVGRLAGIFKGDLYDQSQIDQARRLLNGSIYFKNVKQPKVTFVAEDKAHVLLELESRKSGKFDVLLGILPPREEGAKMQFTGLVDLQLVSPLFRAGEIVQFRYDKLMGSSQKMHLQYSHPYLFGSPMQIQGEFDLLKQDTTFLTRWGRFATAYAFSPNLSMRVYYKGKQSSLISTQAYEQDTTTLPPVLDGKDQTYGIGFEFDNLDYKFNPRKGFRISADLGIGRKKVIRNPRLSELLYQGLSLSLPKKEADFKAEWFQAYTKRMVLRLANRTYWLDQDQFFQNDLLQVGGSRTLRGFNENEFFANFLTLFTLENRFILEENSYLFVFTDYAYLEDATATTKILRPWGVGLGMTYETKAGMLSLTYAAGQAGDQPFQPARGRIHIGLVNQF